MNTVVVIILFLLAIWFFVPLNRKEGYDQGKGLSNISGEWNVYDFTGSDFLNHPEGTITIIDSGAGLEIITNGKRKMATINPARTSRVLYAYIGMNIEFRHVDFTFTLLSDGTVRGIMKNNDTNADYILLPKKN